MLRPTVSRHPSGAYYQILITVRQLRVCWCGTLSLTRERVCRLQFLLVLASAVILGYESRGTRDHILLSKIRDSHNLEVQVPVFISPRNSVAQLQPRGTGFPFLRLQLAGLLWRYSNPPPTPSFKVKVKVKVTLRLTVSQSVSLGVEPHLGLMTRYLLVFNSYDLFFCCVLSDERTGLSFLYALGPRQHSLSRVRVPWASWPYFTVSDLRLPFLSPPTTRSATVEVFEPASTRVTLYS
jgi:hypothetical protein